MIDTVNSGDQLPDVRVSIVMPSYNRESLIAKSLDSVKAQTYRNWECIVVDDGSTDQTVAIVQKYVSGDPRFRFLQRERFPKGGSACRNIGLASSRGEFVVFLDSDDLLAKSCISDRVTEMLASPNSQFIVFQMEAFRIQVGDYTRLVNRKLSDSCDSHLRMFLRHELPWQTSCPIWRKNFLTQLGGFDERFPRLQDPELHTRALACNPIYRLATKRAPDCYYREISFVSKGSDFFERATQAYLLYVDLVAQVISSSAIATQVTPQDLNSLSRAVSDFATRFRHKIKPARRFALVARLHKRGLIGPLRLIRLVLLLLLPLWIIRAVVAARVTQLFPALRDSER